MLTSHRWRVIRFSLSGRVPLRTRVILGAQHPSLNDLWSSDSPQKTNRPPAPLAARAGCSSAASAPGTVCAGHRAAVLTSLIVSCKTNLVELWAYLYDVLNRLAHKPSTEKLTQLLPNHEPEPPLEYRPNPTRRTKITGTSSCADSVTMQSQLPP